jgi:hypothetical protein
MAAAKTETATTGNGACAPPSAAIFLSSCRLKKKYMLAAARREYGGAHPSLRMGIAAKGKPAQCSWNRKARKRPHPRACNYSRRGTSFFSPNTSSAGSSCRLMQLLNSDLKQQNLCKDDMQPTRRSFTSASMSVLYCVGRHLGHLKPEVGQQACPQIGSAEHNTFGGQVKAVQRDLCWLTAWAYARLIFLRLDHRRFIPEGFAASFRHLLPWAKDGGS